jgi:hypothetical protein
MKDMEESPSPQTAYGKGSVPPARVVTHSHLDDGSESIQVGSEEFRSSSNMGSDIHQQQFEGDPAQGEDEVLQVCRSLRGALRSRGETWGRFERKPGPTDDVDAISRDTAGNTLRVQVTRVERRAWKTLAQQDKAEAARRPEDLADDIRVAIEDKSRKHNDAQRADLLLALDALRSPAHTHQKVVDYFIANHRVWAASLRYREIWLVGPTDALSYPLC